MKLTKSTIEKLAEVFIRLGEAAFIGSVAAVFVTNFQHFVARIGILVGIVSIALGLYINNLAERD